MIAERVRSSCPVSSLLTVFLYFDFDLPFDTVAVLLVGDAPLGDDGSFVVVV